MSDRVVLTDAEREALFDAYATSASDGRFEDPVEFLARHGTNDRELAARIEAIRKTRDVSALPDTDPWEGRVLGGFRIERRLGEGGMGVVYRAVELALDRPVALKLLRPEASGSPSARMRLEREAKAVAKLRHPNIVSVFSTGEASGVRYLAMELVGGRGLNEILRDANARGERLPAMDVVRWAEAIANALACGHDHSIVHRDVKPSNVIITDEGRALLVDFGIARHVGTAAATLTEGFVGSPHSMPPERIGDLGGRDANAIADDPRGDVYGLGVLLFECLAGRPPFSGETLEQVFRSVLTDDPPSLRALRPGTTRDLDTVVAKAMAKDPNRRYASAALLRDDLAALREFRPIRARPEGRLERWRRRARRHPAIVASIVMGALSLVVIASALLAQRSAYVGARRREAETALRHARELADAYVNESDTALVADAEYRTLVTRRSERYLSDDEDREVDRLERAVTATRRRRQAMVDQALELLVAAEPAGAAPDDVREIRADLYVARYTEAARVGDRAGADTFRHLVRENDPLGRWSEFLDGATTLALVTDPPSSEAWLYRVVDASELETVGEPRLVARCAFGIGPISPTAWALLVLRDAAPLAPGDLVTSIDGSAVEELVERDGQDATLERMARAVRVTRVRGTSETVELDAESTRPSALRLTTRPLPACPAAALGSTPLDGRTIDAGTYIVVIRATGHCEARVPFLAGAHAPVALRVRLPRLDEAPSGFVPVASDDGSYDWIMRREVTVREYLEFVNDPAIRAAADAGGPQRAPRSLAEGIHCPRGADGLHHVTAEWSLDWPALGISWLDAEAYAAWRTERARREGQPWTFALPTHADWMRACGAPAIGEYVFGDRWRPKWTSSVFAQPTPHPTPVESFPIDESWCGARDLAGSVAEYLNAWWREDVGHRRHAGGSWAHGAPEKFCVNYANGQPAHSPSDTVGFRLICRTAREDSR